MRRFAMAVLCCFLTLCFFAAPVYADEVKPQTQGRVIITSYALNEYELSTTSGAWVKVEFEVSPEKSSYRAAVEDFCLDVSVDKPLKANLIRLKADEEKRNVFYATFRLTSAPLPEGKPESVSWTASLIPVEEKKGLLVEGSVSRNLWVKYRPFDTYPVQEGLDNMWMERKDYGFSHANSGYLPATVIRMLKMELKKGQSMNMDFGKYGFVFTYDDLTSLKAQDIDLNATTEEHTEYARLIESSGFRGEVSYLHFNEQLTAPLQMYVDEGAYTFIYRYDQNFEKFIRLPVTYDGHVYTFPVSELTDFVLTKEQLSASLVKSYSALTRGSVEKSDTSEVSTEIEQGSKTGGKIRLPDAQTLFANSVRENAERSMN